MLRIRYSYKCVFLYDSEKKSCQKWKFSNDMYFSCREIIKITETLMSDLKEVCNIMYIRREFNFKIQFILSNHVHSMIHEVHKYINFAFNSNAMSLINYYNI